MNNYKDLKESNLWGDLMWVPSKTLITLLFMLAIGVLYVMLTVTFPVINSKLGTEAFDLKLLGYEPSEVVIMLDRLDKQTIDYYLFPQLFLLDLVYPILLSLFLSFFILRLLIKTNIVNPQSTIYLSYIPYGVILFGYIENGLIAHMLIQASNVTVPLIRSASFVTQLKSLFTLVSWIIIIVLLIRYKKLDKTNNNMGVISNQS